MAYRILWNGSQAVIREKFIAISTYIKKKRKVLIKQPKFIPQRTREEQTKPKVSKRKSIIKK